MALLSIFLDQQDGMYIDVGAHHPSRFSVTRHLYQLGWSGLNVEANEDLISEFHARRPRDKSIVGYVGTPGVRRFHVFSEPAISTSDESVVNSLLQSNRRLVRTLQTDAVSLRKLLEEYLPETQIDLLNIDAEASDFDVLKSLDLESLEINRWPRYLLLEIKPPVGNALLIESVSYAISKGYIPQLVLPMSTILM